ncbi:MAG TPA: DUF2158 domain-containing protein [Archangium sp.]|uniref:YodC family protein n=1 Tax=Archangium sp. TaxID=1872627 RepID=UPI002E2EE640|nr:DUF2158 domain-containing protein [Archangium sp.]HEX5752301.1 DUF2158 domain-containing protein [Archangium sp.]
MAQGRFQVGDVVKLKSGGPEMTVEASLEEYESYRCQWFAGKKLESGVFPDAGLEPASVKPPIPAPGAGRAGK